MWCDMLTCDVMWCDVMWCDDMWCEMMPFDWDEDITFLTLLQLRKNSEFFTAASILNYSHRVKSPIFSYLILSYLILSYLILSYLLFHFITTLSLHSDSSSSSPFSSPPLSLILFPSFSLTPFLDHPLLPSMTVRSSLVGGVGGGGAAGRRSILHNQVHSAQSQVRDLSR